MSEREKKILEGIAKLPDSQKEKFLFGIICAADAVDAMNRQTVQKGVPEHEPGESRIPRHDGSS